MILDVVSLRPHRCAHEIATGDLRPVLPQIGGSVRNAGFRLLVADADPVSLFSILCPRKFRGKSALFPPERGRLTDRRAKDLRIARGNVRGGQATQAESDEDDFLHRRLFLLQPADDVLGNELRVVIVANNTSGICWS
jgi:hypothetical protein